MITIANKLLIGLIVLIFLSFVAKWLWKKISDEFRHF